MNLDDLRVTPRAFISVAEASAVLELDPRSVRRGCRAGEIPAVYVGARIRIPVPRLLALIEAPTPYVSEPGTGIPGAATAADAEKERPHVHDSATHLRSA